MTEFQLLLPAIQRKRNFQEVTSMQAGDARDYAIMRALSIFADDNPVPAGNRAKGLFNVAAHCRPVLDDAIIA